MVSTYSVEILAAWARPQRTWSAVALALGVCSTLPAAPPIAGIVVEGDSVPGISLGLTRAQIEAEYGLPSYCQGPTQGFCTYTSSGVGSANVRYEASGGGSALGTDEDVVYHISWSGFTNWITTRNVSTATALADPSSVVSAYPAGTIITNAQGSIHSVRESRLGVEVIWNFDFYTGNTTVSISIFEGIGSPEPNPRLALRRLGSDAIALTWPDEEGLMLESNDDLSNDSWAPVLETPTSESGYRTLTLPRGGHGAFFRLAR